MMRIALCPSHSLEMELVHSTVDVNAWHCDACGFVHNITPDGTYVSSTDMLDDRIAPVRVQWVERQADVRMGRITTMEGG